MTTIAISIGSTPAAASTTIAAASAGQSLPQPTVTVASTSGFPSSGSFFTYTSEGLVEVFYTGKTGTTFTGCSNGNGQMFLGSTTFTSPTATAQGGQQPSAPNIEIGLDIAPGSDYTAGGYVFDPSAVLSGPVSASTGLAHYDKAPENIAVLSEPKIVAGHCYMWLYDRVAGKLLLLKDGAADAGTADQSAVGAIRVLVVAK